MQVYSELRGGRFVVIADFEDSKHMGLFQLVQSSGAAKCISQERLGRVETGGGCMEFTAASPDDAVVVTNNSDSEWYLKRDWRAYDLLMMSIYAPKRGLSVDVAIAGGPPDQRLSAYTNVPLERGWNVVRLDLADVAEQVPLDDVQEIRFSLPGVTRRVALRFDDILLTGNRVDLLGDSRSVSRNLYVQRAGRRWNIGAGGLFEVTFGNGQITRWYNLAADPHRVKNLLLGTSLGPSPLLVDSPDADGVSSLGRHVVVRQQIVEMSRVRVVVECAWYFVDDQGASIDGRPANKWTYTIYPTGQIYVRVEAVNLPATYPANALGLAVMMFAAAEDELETSVAEATETSGRDEEGREVASPCFATGRSRAKDAFLLYALSSAGSGARMEVRRDATLRRVSFVAVDTSAGAGSSRRWMSHLLLGSSRLVSDAEAIQRVTDYVGPVDIQMQIGAVLRRDGPTARSDGFDPSTGCYVLSPERGRVRLVLDGRREPLFSPAFRITDAMGKVAWVYVDHLIFDRVARDQNDDLIFQLPDIVRDRRTIEVILQQPRQDGLP